jgi:hypothetical protein
MRNSVEYYDGRIKEINGEEFIISGGRKKNNSSKKNSNTILYISLVVIALSVTGFLIYKKNKK